MSSTQETTSDVQTDRLVGQVKWFNNKAGYGFITVSDGELSSKDIFIHYSSIRVTNSQYKYLVQGEYVEFTLSKPTGEVHEFQASDVSGIKGGALMCETRRQTRPVPSDGSDAPAPGPSTGSQRRYRTPRPSADGASAPRAPKTSESADGFTKVTRKPRAAAKTQKPKASSPPTESA
jgi:cold shock CspA family protein